MTQIKHDMLRRKRASVYGYKKRNCSGNILVKGSTICVTGSKMKMIIKTILIDLLKITFVSDLYNANPTNENVPIEIKQSIVKTR
jgi:hypothetical protein